MLVWLGLFCGCIGGLDDVLVSGAGQNAVHWIGPRFVNISFSAYRPRAQKWPPSPNTHHPFPLSFVCPRPQTSYLSENSSSTCLQLSGNRQGSTTVLSSISILCQLIWGIWQNPCFLFQGPFLFFHSSADKASPALYLTYTPPKTFTGVSSTVSICPILDKTTYPGKISEQSKKYHPPKFVLPHIPGTPKTFWDVL